MRILRGYLTRHMVAGWLMATAILAILLMLVRLIDELDRVTSRYTTTEAMLYVTFTLPQQLIMLAPVIVLIGTLTAFARLEQANEMTMVRGSGLDKSRFLRLLAVPFLVLALTLWGAMEWVTPPLHQLGEEIRSDARGNNSLEPGQSLWSRSDNTFFRVGRLKTGKPPRDIDIYVFSEDKQLLRAIHAVRAEPLGERRWRLHKTLERRWEGGVMTIRQPAELTMDGLWSQDELDRLLLSLDSMSTSVLREYHSYLTRSGQASEAPAMAFWNRLLLPLTTVTMGLLALGLGVKPGSRRSGMGRQLATGALIGVLFYLGSQVVLALGQIFHLPAPATAAFPLACILAAAVLLVYRLRW